MESSQQVNAAHYRAEARRIRRQVATVKDEAIRSQLLEIVTTYEQLAESFESNKLMRRTIGQMRGAFGARL